MKNKIYTSYLRERLRLFGLSGYFPGSQEQYIASRNNGILKARELINRGPAPDLFDRCVSICTEARRNHAIRMNARDSSLFGLHRTTKSVVYYTALSDPRYCEYGTIMRSRLTAAVESGLVGNSITALQHPHVIQQDKFNGISTMLEFRLIPESAMNIIASRPQRRATGDELGTDRYGRLCFTEIYRQNDPARYQQDAIHVVVDALEDKVPWPRPGRLKTIHSYVLATGWLETGLDSRLEMSRYLLRMDQEQATLQPSPIIVLHQDGFLVPQTMNRVRMIFNEIIQAPRDQRNDKVWLRKRLGLIRYLFAQATPLERGSADCAGAIERALAPARDLGLLDRRDAVMEIDLEALTAESLGAFMERYLQGWVSPTPPPGRSGTLPGMTNVTRHGSGGAGR